MTDKNHAKLARQWDGICIICGEPFTNADSITREHIIPRSLGGHNGIDNLAPSHFHCNQMRGNLSLREAMVLAEMRKKQLGDDFKSWVNCSVPNRYPLQKIPTKE